jgi:LmbE family N-acetylglucosaminyl deacetylase
MLVNILAIGAHPDDIEIGCGGSLIKYARAGHNVSLLVLTTGEVGGRPEVRQKEQEAAAKIIGAKDLYWGGFEDTQLVDNLPLILKIEGVVRKVNPDIVFLNNINDVHQDHRAAAQAGLSATRYIREVLFYEVPTTQGFEPDIFVDIGDVLEQKAELLKAHTSQTDKTRVENLNIMESSQSCANFRGFQGRVKYAEGFKALRVLREIK